jgi:hypothetical protein
MSSIEFSLHVAGADDLDSTPCKPPLPIISEAYLKTCGILRADGASIDSEGIINQLESSSRSVIVSHSATSEDARNDISALVRGLRAFEKERTIPLFIVLSLVDMKFPIDDSFMSMCRLAYMAGVDAILIKGVDSSALIQEIRDKALGMRGRRIKIILDDVSKVSDTIQAVDGIIAAPYMESYVARELLTRQKLIFTRSSDRATSLKADVLISSGPQEAGTPSTTVPSSPLISSAMPVLASGFRNFLFNELQKYLTNSCRLIIALSEDGASVSELSSQFRTLATTRRMPPILGLSASESTCRYMGCLFGVIPLQTQSFISVSTVVLHAITHAKEMKIVQDGDEIIVVMQPPPVTASTNEMCFEGVVQKRFVA